MIHGSFENTTYKDHIYHIVRKIFFKNCPYFVIFNSCL